MNEYDIDGKQISMEDLLGLDVVAEEAIKANTVTTVKIVTPNTGDLVVQSNALLDLKHKYLSLTSIEEKLWDLMISKIPTNVADLEKDGETAESVMESSRFINFKINDIINIPGSGFDSKNGYRQIKEALDGLMSKQLKVEYGTTKSGKAKIVATSLLSAYVWNEGSGVCHLEVSSVLAPYMCMLKKEFSKWPLGASFFFKSANTKRLYELIAQWRTIRRKSWSFTELRELMGLGDKYTNSVYNFKKAVITPACIEINDKSDMRVTCETEGRGQSTVFHFEFSEKGGFRRNLTDTPQEPKESTMDLAMYVFRECNGGEIFLLEEIKDIVALALSLANKPSVKISARQLLKDVMMELRMKIAMEGVANKKEYVTWALKELAK